MRIGELERALREAQHLWKETAGADRRSLVQTYRKFLSREQHRLRLAHKRGEGGWELARLRSDLLTVLSRSVWEWAWEEPRGKVSDRARLGITLLAVGGFGRGELCPYSDVDLLFTFDPKKISRSLVDDLVERVLYLLWDIGLEVGHATRSVSEVLELSNKDLETKTSFLDARWIAGSSPLWQRLERDFQRECIHGRQREYLSWRFSSEKERHLRYGGTVFVQEPHVKNGCGGLRDLHNLLWVARVARGCRSLAQLVEQRVLHASDKKQLEDAYSFLLRIRTEMHYQDRHRSDLLTLELQGRVATALGYPHGSILRRIEEMMRDYYRAAQTLHLLTQATVRHLYGTSEPRARRLFFSLFNRTARLRKIDGFVIRKGELEWGGDWASFSKDPHLILRAFLLAQRFDAELGPSLASFLRRCVPLVTKGLLEEEPVREGLLSLFSAKGKVARIARRMHELGLLGRFFPEFAPLTCLVQHEFFHRYTADEHTLVALEALDRVIDASDPPYNRYQPVFQRVDRPYLLYLALLLHDTGRAVHRQHHAEESAANAGKVAKRLRLPSRERFVLEFLVYHHMTMWEVASRRNLDEEETILEFARLVQTKEKLDLLLLITFSDGEGTVGPSDGHTQWRELLIWELYQKTRMALEGRKEFEEVARRSLEELRLRVQNRLGGQVEPEEIMAHWKNLPEHYFVRLSEELIETHLKAIHEFFLRQLSPDSTGLEPVVHWVDRPALGVSEVTVVTWDRERVFARITGAFTAVGLSILSADVYTREDSIVIDTFRVCTLRGEAAAEEHYRVNFCQLLNEAFQREDFSFLPLVSKEKFWTRPLPAVPDFPTRFWFDLDASKRFTVLDIQAPDRPGLLYRIAEALAGAKADIVFARITTEKGAALDTFYLLEEDGQKITDSRRLDEIVRSLREALSL